MEQNKTGTSLFEHTNKLEAKKCKSKFVGLFWGGNGGVCQGNGTSGNGVVQLGAHEAGGTNYDLLFNGSGLSGSTNPQAYWRYCVQCSLLYWQGASGTEAGACPAGVKHYDGGSSTNYNVLSESNY
jgi:hypothetical protein